METAAPVFLCPTCGHFCDTTWDSYEADHLGETRLTFGCHALLGMILIDHLKGYPFQLACLHPDGTYGYAPEVAPGTRADVHKGRSETRLIPPAEAQALLEASPPLHAIVGDAAIEQKIYRILSALLYATYNPLSADHALIDFRVNFVDEGFQLADYLAGLSDASPLAHHYTDSPDANFTALQQEVFALIQEHYWVVFDAGLSEHLEAYHVLAPALIREALTPVDEPAEDEE
jgi:hypothetical protein